MQSSSNNSINNNINNNNTKSNDWRALVDAELISRDALAAATTSTSTATATATTTTNSKNTKNNNDTMVAAVGVGATNISGAGVGGGGGERPGRNKKVIISGITRGSGSGYANANANANANARPPVSSSSSSASKSGESQSLDDVSDAPMYIHQLQTKSIVDKISIHSGGGGGDESFSGNSRPIAFRVDMDESQLNSLIKMKSCAEFPSVHRFPLPSQIDAANHNLRLPISFNSVPTRPNGGSADSMASILTSPIGSGGGGSIIAGRSILNSRASGSLIDGKYDRETSDGIAQIRFLEASFFDHVKKAVNLRADSITIGKYIYSTNIPPHALELRYIKVTYFLLRHYNELADDLVGELSHLLNYKVANAFAGSPDELTSKGVYSDAKFAVTAAFRLLMDEAAISQSTLYNIFESIEEILGFPREYSRRIDGLRTSFDRHESILSEKYHALSKKSRNYVIHMERRSMPVNIKVFTYLQSSQLNTNVLDLSGSRFAPGELEEMLRFLARVTDLDDKYEIGRASAMPPVPSRTISQGHYLSNLRILIMDGCEMGDLDMHNICQILLRRLASLNFLSLRANKFNIAGITTLALCFYDGHGTNLTTLRLDNNNLTSESITIFSRALQRLRKLTKLSVSNNPAIGDKGCFLLLKHLLLNRFRSNYVFFHKSFRNFCVSLLGGLLQGCVSTIEREKNDNLDGDDNASVVSGYSYGSFVSKTADPYDDDVQSIFTKSSKINKEGNDNDDNDDNDGSKKEYGIDSGMTANDNEDDDHHHDMAALHLEKEKVICFLPLLNGMTEDLSRSKFMRQTFNWHDSESPLNPVASNLSVDILARNRNPSDFLSTDPYSDSDNEDGHDDVDDHDGQGDGNCKFNKDVKINPNIKLFVPPVLENRYKLCKAKFLKIQYRLFVIITLLQLSRRVRIDRLSMQNCGLSYMSVNMLRIAMTDRYYENNNNIATLDLSGNPLIGSNKMTKEIESNLDSDMTRLAATYEPIVARQLSFRLLYDVKTILTNSQLGSLMLAGCGISDEDCQKILQIISGSGAGPTSTTTITTSTTSSSSRRSKEAIKHTASVLEYIDLSNNNMGGTGANWVVNSTGKFIIENLEFS